jgi:hypothetical protein
LSDLKFEVKLTATAEVRDKDGNLKDADPVEITTTITEDQAKALGLIEGEQS